MKDVVERRVSATLSGGGPGANISRNHVSGTEVDLALLPAGLEIEVGKKKQVGDGVFDSIYTVLLRQLSALRRQAPGSRTNVPSGGDLCPCPNPTNFSLQSPRAKILLYHVPSPPAHRAISSYLCIRSTFLN